MRKYENLPSREDLVLALVLAAILIVPIAYIQDIDWRYSVSFSLMMLSILIIFGRSSLRESIRSLRHCLLSKKSEIKNTSTGMKHKTKSKTSFSTKTQLRLDVEYATIVLCIVVAFLAVCSFAFIDYEVLLKNFLVTISALLLLISAIRLLPGEL